MFTDEHAKAEGERCLQRKSWGGWAAGVTAEAYQNFDVVLTQLLPVRVEIRATQAARKSYNNVAFLTGTLKLSEPASSSDPNPHMLLFLDFSRC